MSILINKKIEKLIQENHLGNSIINIDKVIGGLSHRMYKVETNKGIYAVKELNAGVMKKEKAYSNFVFSEKVTDIVIENGISAIGAIKFNNDIMVKIEFLIEFIIDTAMKNSVFINTDDCPHGTAAYFSFIDEFITVFFKSECKKMRLISS